MIQNTHFAFRNRICCLTNLLDFFTDVANYVDKGSQYDIAYLDFQKAFHVITHSNLINVNLKCIRINGYIQSRVKCWPYYRKHAVVDDECAKFEQFNVKSGVIQGSVLGPTHFIIFVYDKNGSLISRISKFADDTRIGGKALSPQVVLTLQNAIKMLSDW